MNTVTSGAGGVMRNNRFVLAIGKEMLSFSKVTNMSRNTEYDTIVEGGLNSMVHTFTKAKQQQETLILEKGVNISRKKDSENLAKMGLKPGGRINQAVTLVVLGDDQKTERRYGFDEGVVIRWEIGGLDAMGSEVLIERFEIAHSGLKELE
jgi:phage tail-like protein